MILEEAIGCYRTALALRPAASAAHINLGIAAARTRPVGRGHRRIQEGHRPRPQARRRPTTTSASHCGPRTSWTRPSPNTARPSNSTPSSRRPTTTSASHCRPRTSWTRPSPNSARPSTSTPSSRLAHDSLGIALQAKNQLDEAIGEYTQGHRTRPQVRDGPRQPRHRSAGKNQLDEAIAEYSKAIDLDPKYAMAHNNLGNALLAKNQLDEAIAEYRKAIELDPKLAMAHNNLGIALQAKNQLDEAIAEYQKAIELDPKLRTGPQQPRQRYCRPRTSWTRPSPNSARPSNSTPSSHWPTTTSASLSGQEPVGRSHRRIPQGHRTRPQVRTGPLQPRHRSEAKNQLDEAIAEYRKVIDLQTDCYAEAHCNLADILRSQGQLSASLDFYKRGHASGSKRKDWRYPSAQWVADAERLVRLEAKLRRRSRRESHGHRQRRTPWPCGSVPAQRRHAAAARLYADAFTADAKLADDLKAGHRYNAACFAALAAAGQGTDADKLDDQEHRRLRQQALAWLRADLEQWANDWKAASQKIARPCGPCSSTGSATPTWPACVTRMRFKSCRPRSRRRGGNCGPMWRNC